MTWKLPTLIMSMILMETCVLCYHLKCPLNLAHTQIIPYPLTMLIFLIYVIYTIMTIEIVVLPRNSLDVNQFIMSMTGTIYWFILRTAISVVKASGHIMPMIHLDALPTLQLSAIAAHKNNCNLHLCTYHHGLLLQVLMVQSLATLLLQKISPQAQF